MDITSKEIIPFVDVEPFWIWLTPDEIKFLSERANACGYDLTSDFVVYCLGFNRG